MTIRIAFPRLRCWREATGATTPYYGFRAHRSLASWSPRRTSGCSEETVGAPTAKLDDVCAQAR
jgi:hypothetical protein